VKGKAAKVVLWKNATNYRIKSSGVASEVPLGLGWSVGRGGEIWL
jgi:hypothetical protein